MNPIKLDFFMRLVHITKGNDYTAMRLHNLYETRLKLVELPLPTTHKALNSRASIIQILNELEEYLQIKSQFGSLKMHSEVA